MASEPLDLLDEDAIDLGSATDFHILLQAIDEVMPQGSVLVLEGDATAPAVAEFLREREPADKPELVANSRGSNRVLHLPLAGDNLTQLRVLADSCAGFEVAFHLMVYRGDEVLLWAHDAGDGSLLLARSLPEETLEGMRTALGDSLKPQPSYGLFGWLRRSRQQ